MKIHVETTVAEPIAKVWTGYTSADAMTKWNFASDDWHAPRATVDLREGGTFSSRMEAKDGSAGFDFAGTYTRIIRHELIAYTFGDRTAEVTFSEGPGGVTVGVTFDSEDENPVDLQRAGWQSILNNFKRYVETP